MGYAYAEQYFKSGNTALNEPFWEGDSEMTNDLQVYEKFRSQMLTGDALLYKSKGSVIGWAIRKFTEFNHAGLVLRFGPDECGSDRVWTLEAIGRGVKPTHLSQKLVSYHGEVWWYPLVDQLNHRRALMAECAMILKDTDYDFRALLKNALGYVSVNLRQLFCSEYDFVVWKYAKAVEGDKAPRPGDIPALMIFKEPIKIIG